MFFHLRRTSLLVSSRIIPQRFTSNFNPPQYIEKPSELRKQYEDEQRKIKLLLDHARPFREIPGPASLPLIKSLWMFTPYIGLVDRTSVEGFYGRLYKKFGKLVRVSTPERDLVFCFDPNYVKALFHSEIRLPVRPGMEALLQFRRDNPRIYSSMGLFFSQGEEWYNLRKTATKYFHKTDIIQHYIPPIQEVAQDFVSRMKIVRDSRGEVKDFIQELFKWALESVGLLGLNRRLGCLEYNLSPYSETRRIITSLHDTFTALHNMESGYTFYKHFDTPNYKRLTAAQTYFQSMIMKYVHEAIADAKENPEEGAHCRHWVLSNLLRDGKINDKTAAVLINDMFFAGVETTATAAMFALYHLARNPDKQEKLRTSVLKAKEQLPVNKRAITDNRYMLYCLDESQRLNPVTVGTARILQHDLELAGYRLPAGTLVAAIFAQIGRMEEFFEKPLEFIPERFTPQHREAGIKFPKMSGSVLPFGTGVRQCLGKSIATYELSILISEILMNFQIEHLHPKIDFKLGLVNSPDRPVHLTLNDINDQN